MHIEDRIGFVDANVELTLDLVDFVMSWPNIIYLTYHIWLGKIYISMNTLLSLKSIDVCKPILKIGAQKYVVVLCIRSEITHTRDCYLSSLLFSLSQGQK